MEDSPKDHSSKIKIKIKYFINQTDKEEKGHIELKYLDNIINYKYITTSFEHYIKSKDPYQELYSDWSQYTIIYEYIRYSDGDGWFYLMKDDSILLDNDLNINNLELMIKASIIKNYEEIGKQIDSLAKNEEDKNCTNKKEDLYLVVLTSDPLVHKHENNIQYLRTMNDFNNIKSMIYDIFKEDLKYTKFLTLTKQNLKEVITNKEKRPKILHLICKSTYIIPEQAKDNSNDDIIITTINGDKQQDSDSSDYVNLVFEEENNYNMELMNKEYFKELFEDENIKKNIAEIILVISTPLAEDVYNIFKYFGFKNIFVQHITLANSSFVIRLNYNFYKYILKSYPNNKIQDIYKQALEDLIKDIKKEENKKEVLDRPTSCCCFHKHKKNCEFMKNLKNELYDLNEGITFAELKKCIPHFFHLIHKCILNKGCCYEDNFCKHKRKCSDYYKEDVFKKVKIKQKNDYNLCCCYNEKKEHNISKIFTEYCCSNKNNNNVIEFNLVSNNENKYIFDYQKKSVLVGKNKIIYDSLKFINSKETFLNIYYKDINELENLGHIIKEYYMERNKDINYKISIKSVKSMQNLNKKNNDIDLDLISIKSSPFVNNPEKRNKIIEIKLNNNKKNIFRNDSNIIYFIYVYDINLVHKIDNISNKKIIFSENAINNYSNNSIEMPPPFVMKTPNEYVKLGENENDKFIPNEYIEFQHKDNIKFVLKNSLYKF